MSVRGRIAVFFAAAIVHLAVLAPLADNRSSLIERGFAPEAEAILDGARPYAERAYEYPPLSLGPVLAPALVSESPAEYGEAFAWEMIAVDLAILAMLTLALRGPPARIAGAIGTYSAGLIALSGVLLPDSQITDDGALALARFDLVPAALVLAAVLLRDRGRSASWGAVLGLATAVKAFPALLFAPLAREEPDPRRVAIAALAPLALAAALVLALGDSFGSAISYHSDRGLHVETVAATPMLIAHTVFGAGATTEVGGGSYNVVASGAGAARWISIVAGALAYLLVVREAWRHGAGWLTASTAVLTVAVVFAPVLSPQFLLWLLPVGAATFGARAPGLVLVAACVLTQIALANYVGVNELEPEFVWSLAARNAALLIFGGLAIWALRNSGSIDGWQTSADRPTLASSS